MSNNNPQQQSDVNFFIPEEYSSYANVPISNAGISNDPIDFQTATNPFQDKNSISAKPQESSYSHVIDFILRATTDAAQQAAKQAAEHICEREMAVMKTALETTLKTTLETTLLDTTLETTLEVKLDKLRSEIYAEMRARHSSQTKDLNGALSK